MSVATIVDLDRYPIDGSDPSRLNALVEGCRRDLAANGASVIEGFVRPEAIGRIVAQVDPLAPLAFHKVKQHNVYLEPDDPDLPADHPRNASVTTTSATLGNQQLQGVDELQML